MDELKIKTKFMRNMLSKIIENVIRKETGYKIKIQLKDVEVSVTDDIAHISLSAEGDININEFKKISRIIDLED